jgi:ubiquinone/menaquinone biosynthesis C-methylase UbiE
LAALPGAYGQWRNSRLGRITDALEQQLMFAMIGPLTGLRVLDVGCGDGDLAVALLRAGAQVTALDRDPRMLAAARRRFKSEGAGIRLYQAAAEALPFTDGSFDMVIAVTVLCFIQDHEPVVREMARILKPGGRLLIGELNRYSSWAAWRRIRGWAGHKLWRAARFRSVHELYRLASAVDLEVRSIRGATFYPPFDRAAAAMAALDKWLSRRMVFGSAFLALLAVKKQSK